MLDGRYETAWAEFSASGAAEEDRERFTTSLYRKNFPHVFPPPVFSTAVVDAVEGLGVAMARLIGQAPARVFGQDTAAWMDYLDVPTADRGLLAAAMSSPRLRDIATTFVRPDLIHTAEGLKVVEINVSAPMGGMNTHDPYVAAVGRSAYGDFLRGRQLRPEAPDMAAAWLSAFESVVRTPRTDEPHVFEGLANPADIDSGRRFFVDMLRRGGYRVSSGLMSELDITESGVRHGGRKVDVVFTMYTWHETRKFVPPALTASLIELDGAGAVDFIGSPASALFDNKANLELLTDERYEAHFTDEERALLRGHVPRTFRLTTRTVDEALANRARLVCKPASAYGGKGIVLGRTTTPEEWAAVVRARAHDRDDRHVCQDLVSPAVAYDDQEVCFGPMVYGGTYAGTLVRQVRAARAAVINVTAGAEAAIMLRGS